MDQFKELPREAQITIGCLVLFVILSFFDWQQYSNSLFTVGKNLWHGFGIIVVLVAIAYLIWEISRALNYSRDLGPVNPPQTSAGLAIALLVLTVITFLDWSQYRNWPEWVGLILAVVIAVVAFKRAKDEGVEMPKIPQGASANRAEGTAAAPPPPPPPTAPAEPAPPAEGAEPEAQA